MPNWSSSPLRGALLAAVTSAAVVASGSAWAQPRTFIVPAAPAPSGAGALARPGEVQVSIATADARGRRPSALVGIDSIERLLQLLLIPQ